MRLFRTFAGQMLHDNSKTTKTRYITHTLTRVRYREIVRKITIRGE